MKRTATLVVLIIPLIISSYLFSDNKNDFRIIQSSKSLKLSFVYKMESYNQHSPDDAIRMTPGIQTNNNHTYNKEDLSQRIKEAIAQFSLGLNSSSAFSSEMQPGMTLPAEQKKYYSKTTLEISAMNVGLWAFNKYFAKKTWANISWKSIVKNFLDGCNWDFDKFSTNLFDHPYHGAIHYSTARANGFNFFESSIWAFLGSFMWEFILETRGIRNNPPSTNDLMINTLGGATLGEALFRMADLVIDESSVGLERTLRESLAFLINPAYGFRVFSGKAFKRGNPPENSYYSLSFPFGAYGSSINKLGFLIAASMEYREFLKKESSEINPYDWFSFDFKLGHYEEGFFHDAEIFTTGVLIGKKVKYGVTGLFGVFDYIDTYIANRMSAVGVGPGLVTIFVSDSDLFFNSSGVLSIIIGASSPSIDSENYHFGLNTNDPYYLGPGMLGKVKLELGKLGLGSIDTEFSQYWVHSIYTHVNEFLAILSLNLKYNLSNKSQISLGYDYYLRHALLQEQRFTGARPAFRAMYILKF